MNGSRYFLIAGMILLSSVGTFNASAQLRTGLLVGGGLGFERNVNSYTLEEEGTQSLVRYLSDYQFDLQLGYRFRIENPKNKKLFYDIDVLLNTKVFKEVKQYYSMSGEENGGVTAHDANGALALSPSINYTLVKGFYAGIGVEPTFYFVSEGKKFDIPIVWKVGYNINNKIDFAVNYRLGLTNTIDSRTFEKGQVSDLNISVFIPFTLSKSK